MQPSTALSQQAASVTQITIIDLAVRFGPRLLIAILILVAGAMASRWVSRWSARAQHFVAATDRGLRVGAIP
jgi:hypothetical protein